MHTIKHSSDYRSDLFHASIEEWKSDPRILLFGRSVYVPVDYEDTKSALGDRGGFVVTNLVSGTCHALLPSVLVQYGALGCIFYYLVYIGLLIFLWRVHRQSVVLDYSSSFQVLSFAVAIAAIASLPIATIGGSWFGFSQVVVVLLLKAMANKEEQEKADLESQSGELS